MKTSSKILLVAAGALLMILALGMVGMRMYVDRLVEKTGVEWSDEDLPGSDEWLERSYDLDGFSRLKISGGWEVDIRQDSDYSVLIMGPEKYLDQLKAGVSGEVLNVDPEGRYRLRDGGLRLELTMPRLEGIESAGGLDLDFHGFSGERLEIECSGGSSITGSGGSYELLDFESRGGAELDFSDLPTVDARLRSSGAVEAVLTMEGGRLSGKISGAGSVTYYGDVDEQSLSTEGIVEVKRGGR